MAITLIVHVVPRSKKQSFVEVKNSPIKIHLKSNPEKGAANIELIRFISKKLKIPQKNIVITSGGSGRKKMLLIENVSSKEELLRKLIS